MALQHSFIFSEAVNTKLLEDHFSSLKDTQWHCSYTYHMETRWRHVTNLESCITDNSQSLATLPSLPTFTFSMGGGLWVKELTTGLQALQKPHSALGRAQV